VRRCLLVFLSSLLLVAGAACARRTGAAGGAGAAASAAATTPGGEQGARARPPTSTAPSASAAPGEPALPVPAALRAACALAPDEQPLRLDALADGGGELLLTNRRLCARQAALDAGVEARVLPLHRLLRARLVPEGPDRAALLLHDLDFFPWSLLLGRRDDAAQGALVGAIEGAWRAARAAFPPPSPPARPFALPPPASAPRRPDGPGRPRYDHAARLARSGQLDAARYWLEEAALTEGAPVKRAEADPALAPLRHDARGPELRAFLVAAAESWALSTPHRDPIALPRARAPGAPLPVALYLHGIHSRGEIGPREQRLADELGIAIVAVDGTLPSGERRFRWSESAELDLARLDAALARHSGELGARGPLLLYGFSQGGAAAGELALRYPERFAGVLLLSPGTATKVTLDDVVPTPAHARLILRCDAAAGEAGSTVETTRQYCAAGERVGARTRLRLVEDATAHAFPEDFRAVFTGWVRAALAAAGSKVE